MSEDKYQTSTRFGLHLRIVKILIFVNANEYQQVPTSKHLQIRNETKQNKTKLNYQFDFGLPKQNKIQKILILFHQN
jgi:hypothetical protein